MRDQRRVRGTLAATLGISLALLTLGTAGGEPAHAQPPAATQTHASFVGAVPLEQAAVDTGGGGQAPGRAPAKGAARPPQTGALDPAVLDPAVLDPAVLDPAVLDLALDALACARKAGTASERADQVLSVIDFRLPSTAPRLWVIDLDTGATLFSERVSHGRNTGEDAAVSFSNIPGSNQSSLGLFRTGETYVGKHGRSMRLDGLEPGFNDRARDRAIVVHAADYCTGEHVAQWGRLGRSQGCPALDPAVSDAVIDTIRDGTLLFAYYPDPDWLSGSSALRCEGPKDGA